MAATATPIPKNMFMSQSLNPSTGVYQVCMRLINGGSNPNTIMAFDLDKAIGLSDRQPTTGQTGFFTGGLTRDISLDTQDKWILHYRVYPAPGENQWSNDQTFDLCPLFELDSKFQMKTQEALVALNSPKAKQGQGSTATNDSPATDAPPQYQPDVGAKDQELVQAKTDLANIKTEVEKLRGDLQAAKADNSMKAALHKIKVTELKSKLRTARSTSRTEIQMLKRTIRHLRENEDSDEDSDEDGADHSGEEDSDEHDSEDDE